MFRFDIRAIKGDITGVIINIYLRNELCARYVGVSFTFTGSTKINGSRQEAATGDSGYALVDVTFLQCDGRSRGNLRQEKLSFNSFSVVASLERIHIT